MSLIESDLANALDQAGGAVLITDTDGRIVYVNKTFSTTTGYTIDEVLGKKPSMFQSKKTSRDVYDDLWKTIREGKVWNGRLLNKRKPQLPMRIAGGNPRKENNEYWARITVTPIRNRRGEIYLYAAIQYDISEHVETQRLLDFDRVGAQTRAQIASVLQKTSPLHDRVSESLEILSSLEELHIENKCGIFIANEERTHLDMFAMHGEFSKEFIDREQQIPFGNCLCGRAVVSGEIIISDDCFCDDRHENTFVGMTPHGHYIIPLRVNDTTIGVMFLYTRIFPSRNQTRINMLKNVGHLIAQAIQNDQIEQRTIETSESAIASSMAKSDFLANMSHEIRTPLNGILGFTDMLLRDDERTTEEDRAQWLGIIQSSGQHLLQLINNILDISKVESGEIDLEMTPCNLMSTLANLASVMRIHATDKMIDLKVESSGRLPKSIITDPTRFRQILTNLVANAIKFTETGSVTMRTHLRDTGDEQVAIIIEIIDTGMGIPEDKLESIFEPFSQAESSITRNFGGTGLGLTISRNLTMAMGGTLCVSSIEGAGSTFTVSLPIGKASEIKYQEDSQNESIHGDQATTTKKSVKDRLSGHVLLIDDGQTNRQLISLILKRAGAKVTTANDGQEGFDRATKTDFDLILMDMQMPIMDGYTASAKLREHGVTTPIIALTASAMARDRKRCIGAGCSDYLTKPVNIEELIDHAEQWMNNPKALSQTDDETDTTQDSPQTSPALVSTLPMDDPELREIVLSYIESLPQQLTDIELAHENENYLLLSSIVHKFIGLGGMVGLEPLTVAAVALKECVLYEEFEEIAHAIAELRDITARAQRGAMELPPIKAEPS